MDAPLFCLDSLLFLALKHGDWCHRTDQLQSACGVGHEKLGAVGDVAIGIQEVLLFGQSPDMRNAGNHHFENVFFEVMGSVTFLDTPRPSQTPFFHKVVKIEHLALRATILVSNVLREAGPKMSLTPY